MINATPCLYKIIFKNFYDIVIMLIQYKMIYKFFL